MTMTQQEYVATMTEQKARDLIVAYAKIPADKRGWSPGGTARTALDLFAECILMNSYTVRVIELQAWSDDALLAYETDKAAVAVMDLAKQNTLLMEGAQSLAAVIRIVPDEALSVVIEMPWSNQTLSEVIAYQHWNLSYHEGQINYIASILGVLE